MMGTILRWLTGSSGSYILIAVAVAFVALAGFAGVQRKAQDQAELRYYIALHWAALANLRCVNP